MAKLAPEEMLSTALHGLYIPAFLVIAGVAIIDWHYLPYAVGLVLVFGGHKIWRGRKWFD